VLRKCLLTLRSVTIHNAAVSFMFNLAQRSGDFASG
jgi:hypothetical protein